MPGSKQCARCGASLALASSEIDVHPPRANPLVRRLPYWWSLWRGTHVVRNWLADGFRAVAGSAQPTHIDTATLFRSLLPGWPQWHRGDRERASLFAAAFLFFLGTGILFTGRVLGSFLLGFAFSVHVASIADALVVHYASWRDRVGFTLLTSLAIFFVAYFPAGWAISRVATPFQINGPLPPFLAGDVLWYNRSSRPEVGDWVLYELPRFTINGRTAGGHAARFRIEGQRINRVVAKAGNSFEWDGKQLLVDGKPSRWQPEAHGRIHGLGHHQGGHQQVPSGRWLILPNHLLPAGANPPGGYWRRVALIPDAQVHGKVFFQSLPLRKMRPLSHADY